MSSLVQRSFGLGLMRAKDLGDWGKQYGLLAVAYERNGSEEELKKNPIDHLFKLYVQINKDMKEENEAIKAKKEAGEDVSKLEANSLDEQARKYFRHMVLISSVNAANPSNAGRPIEMSGRWHSGSGSETSASHDIKVGFDVPHKPLRRAVRW